MFCACVFTMFVFFVFCNVGVLCVCNVGCVLCDCVFPVMVCDCVFCNVGVLCFAMLVLASGRFMLDRMGDFVVIAP